MRSQVVFPTLAMLAVLTVAAMSSYSVAVLAPEAAPAIGVASTYIGAYVSIVYATAMLSGVITGAFVGRYGAVRVCQFSTVGAAGSMALLALASIPAAIVSAMLLGAALGPFNPASAHILVKVAEPQWRPLIFSIKQTGVPLGGALAGALTPQLVNAIGWKGAAFAIGALALTVLVVLRPLRPVFDADRDPKHPLSRISVVAPLRLVLGHRRLRPLALVAFAYAGVQLSVSAFMVVYLTHHIGMSLVRAGLVLALIQGSGMVGRIFWGAVAGRIISARRLLIFLGLTMAATLAAMASITANWPLIVVLLLASVLGASSLGWNGVSLSEMAARAPEGKITEATGGVQFIMFAGIVLVPPSFGAVVGLSGSYTAAFSLIAALALAASIYAARPPRDAQADTPAGAGRLQGVTPGAQERES